MPFQTEAFVIAEKNAPFVLEKIELDDPLDDEVLVEIVACGLCHTDLLVASGHLPSPYPCTLGHEGAGRVIKAGKGVTRTKVGDEVLLSFSYCQTCKTCDAGHPAGCRSWRELNFGRTRSDGSNLNATLSDKRIHGTFFGQSALAKHALVVESSCTVVPKGSDLVQLSPLGCGMQTGAGAVMNALNPARPERSTIVVFGSGAVGMAAIFAAAAIGMQTIIAVDLQDSRLEIAKAMGATHGINGRSDVLAKIKEICNGPCDYSIDATGAAPCIKAAWECLGSCGKMVQLGDPGPGNSLPIGIHDTIVMSKQYIGLAEGDSNPPEFIPKLIKLYEEGKFPLNKISKTFHYSKLEDAIHAMHDGSVIKPIITFA